MTRSARPTARTWDDEPVARAARPGGLPLRLAELILSHPVTAGGVFLSLTMIGVIAGNALGNQPSRHPHPWFQTRVSAEPAKADVVPLPQPAPQLQPAEAKPLIPTAPVVAPSALPRPRPIGSAEPATLRDLQTALRDHGLYAGQLDGVMGPATAEAIRAFEKRIGAPVTGEPSELLLATARALHPAEPATTASTPLQTQRRSDVQPTPAAGLDMRPTGSIGAPSMRIAVADAVAAPVSVEEANLLPVVDEVEGPVLSGAIRRAQREPLAAGGDTRLQKLQRGLIAAGYGPLKADGRWDDRSASAVRRFEADRGWPVTGRPSARLQALLSPPAPTAAR
ncbi:MAG: peptidoglycan-binding protein [Hyphomicrobiales bacterium]|nr:peptidoglycan-binding protein [Hyphomicrobiales bacterium]